MVYLMDKSGISQNSKRSGARLAEQIPLILIEPKKLDAHTGLNGAPTSQSESIMLVLSRKAGQRIVISEEITITVLDVQGSRVRIGFDAHPSVMIRRSEIPFGHPVKIVGENVEVDNKVERVSHSL